MPARFGPVLCALLLVCLPRGAAQGREACAATSDACAPLITWRDIAGPGTARGPKPWAEAAQGALDRASAASGAHGAGIYVSIVCAGRNDNYGGSRFVDRVQLFADNLLAFACEAFAGGSAQLELVLVDYNSPRGTVSLADALHWPPGCAEAVVRVVTVPPAAHGSIRNPNNITFLEHIAKNVGIRAARGQYILVTNPDILLSEEVLTWLAARQLRPDVFYRIDRHDLGPSFSPPPSAVSGGTSLERARALLSASLAFFEHVQVSGADGVWPSVGTVSRAQYTSRLRQIARAGRETQEAAGEKGGREVFGGEGLHTMAAGDFFLMAAQHWHALRGYPEVPTNMEVDSHMCVLTAAAGLRQSVLKEPLRIFHQFHSGSERARREIPERDTEGSIGQGLWRMFGYLLAGQQHRMRRGRRVWVVLNDLGWGLCCFLGAAELAQLEGLR